VRFSLDWLRDHLDSNADLEQIAAILTNIGLEVESVYDPQEALKNIIVAKIESAEKHPQADRLKVCMVNNGKETLQIICGAPNARVGIYAALAPPGSIIPNGVLAIKKTKIRGMESMGMMCSSRELMLGENHEGIIEINPCNDSMLGKPIADVMGLDSIMEVSVSPNRSDCFAVRGIARDLAAAGIGHLKPIESADEAKGFNFPLKVSFEDERLNKSVPLLALQAINGVENVESPDWLKRRLKSAGLEPISALVDITNYFCLNMARPLHAYDMGRINGESISIRRSKSGEEFRDIKGRALNLPDGIAVISDPSGILGVLGVMGGERSKVGDQTSTVVIESALFDPTDISRAGRQLNIVSEARTRFERGIDENYTLAGLRDAVNMIVNICGGQPSNMYVRDVRKCAESTFVKLRLSRLEEVSAMQISADTVKEKLYGLGLNVTSENKDELVFSAPSWRHDISIEEDLIEEVFRLVGYEHAPTAHMPPGLSDDLDGIIAKEDRILSVKKTLCACGLDEVVTYAFLSHERNVLFCDEEIQSIELANPISVDLSVMRCSILPNLISACLKNKNAGADNMAIFEVGSIYKSLERQVLMASGCILDCMPLSHWSGNINHDVFTVKSCIMSVIETLGHSRNYVQVSFGAQDWYHPSRSGKITIEEKTVAWFGEIHPQTLKKMDAGGYNVLGFEINLDALFSLKTKAAKLFSGEKRLQPVVRDFAFVLNKNIPAGDVLNSIKSLYPDAINDVNVFDVYEGDKVGQGKRSLAIRVKIAPTELTFTDEQLQDMSRKIIFEVQNKFSGIIRQ
jgi:phenylalanyl-tRNA synthetase beta chain